MCCIVDHFPGVLIRAEVNINQLYIAMFLFSIIPRISRVLCQHARQNVCLAHLFTEINIGSYHDKRYRGTKSEEQVKHYIYFSFVCLSLVLYIPENTFSVYSGRFPGLNQC